MQKFGFMHYQVQEFIKYWSKWNNEIVRIVSRYP